MAHRTRIRVNLAAWANNSAVLNTEYDALDAAQFSAIDGDAGGSWNPSSKVTLGGANGLDVPAPFRALGAVGFNASMQAQNWPERSSVACGATLNAYVPIAYSPSIGSGKWVAMPDDRRPYTSEDGSVWTQNAAPGLLNIADVAAGTVSGSPAFLFIDNVGNNFWKSTSGATLTSGGSGALNMSVLTYATSISLWVAAGSSGIISTSPDGVNWTARTAPAGWIAGCGSARRIVWNGSIFVIIPSSAYSNVLTSSDGITWTERAIGSSGTWMGLAWGSYNSLWMIISAGGLVYISSDGITWVARTTTPAASGVRDLAVNGPLWVVANTQYVAWSVDFGATWQTTNVGSHVTSLQGYSRIICADNRFLMARSSATLLEFVQSLRSS